MARRQPLRVLIADDDPRVRRALRAYLEMGRDIAVVGESATAGDVLAQVRVLHPAVILLDLLLPTAEDGLALLATLTDWPVVALSVRGGLRELALQGGAAAFVEKGAAPDVLLAAIRTAGDGPRNPRRVARH
jgi:DNA-binding NarL/FixJ family response regulator